MKKETVLRHFRDKNLTFNDIKDMWENDKELMMEAIRQSSNHFYYIGESLKDDKELALLALESNIYVFSNISDRLREDKELVLDVISKDVMLLKYASEELQNNLDFLRILRENDHWLKNVEKLKILHLQTKWEQESYRKQKAWFEERMNVLNILEDDIQMRESVPEAPIRKDIKKF